MPTTSDATQKNSLLASENADITPCMGDIFEFAGRHLLVSAGTTIGIVIFTLGCLEQGRIIVTRFSAWALQLTGGLTFALFLIIILVDFEKSHLIKSEKPIIPEIKSNSLVENSQNSTNSIDKIKSTDVIDVSELPNQITFKVSDTGNINSVSEYFQTKELVKIAKNKTNAQLKKDIKPYIGSILTFHGRIHDVSVSDYDKIATIEVRQLDGSFERGTVNAKMKENSSMFENLGKGTEIKIKGKIDDINEYWVYLIDTEVIWIK